MSTRNAQNCKFYILRSFGLRVLLLEVFAMKGTFKTRHGANVKFVTVSTLNCDCHCHEYFWGASRIWVSTVSQRDLKRFKYKFRDLSAIWERIVPGLEHWILHTQHLVSIEVPNTLIAPQLSIPVNMFKLFTTKLHSKVKHWAGWSWGKMMIQALMSLEQY